MDDDLDDDLGDDLDDVTRTGGSLEQLDQVVRLRGPADILGVLPYRLGFHPHESLVLVCLEGPRRRDRLVMRVDLPDTGGEVAAAHDLAERAARVGASAVVAVVYTEAGCPDRVDGIPDGAGLHGSGDELPRADLVDALVDALDDALADHDIELPEALLVRRGRWWSYRCADPACCPVTGTSLPAVPTEATTRYAAEAVAQGEVVLAGRGELAGTMQPSDHAVARAVRAQAAEAAARLLCAAVDAGGLPAARALTRSRLAMLRRRWAQGDRRIEAGDAAVVVLGLRDKRVRDEVMTGLLDDEPGVLLGLLVELTRYADDLDAAPVCTVVGWVAYATGHGALAAVAVDRALRAEPGYPLAELLRTGMDRMVEPGDLRRICRQVRADLAARSDPGADSDRGADSDLGADSDRGAGTGLGATTDFGARTEEAG